jgi:hypothetical protein
MPFHRRLRRWTVLHAWQASWGNCTATSDARRKSGCDASRMTLRDQVRHDARMSSEAIARLREVRTLLASFDGPSSIHRADELEGAVEEIGSCALDLADRPAPDRLQLRFARAVKALEAARKAARAHRRNPLTRPLSHARFALNMGKAGGCLQGALDGLEAEDASPPS